MPLLDHLYHISFVLGLLLSVAIAAFVFPLWRRYRLRFLLIFGFSALFDIFTTLVEFAALGLPDADYGVASKVIQILHIIGILIVGVGFLLLVRHVRSAGILMHSSSTVAPPNV